MCIYIEKLVFSKNKYCFNQVFPELFFRKILNFPKIFFFEKLFPENLVFFEEKKSGIFRKKNILKKFD